MVQIFRLLTTFALATSAIVAVPAVAAAAPAKNVVLVHGAFADGSGWVAVSNILQKDGYKVSIVQPPETSLEDDAAATKRVLDAQNGPTVLVGHSYGGIVVTAAGGHPNVKSLVYVAAFVPDVGESLLSLGQKMPAASTAIRPSADGFLVLDQGLFHADFCADLPTAEADFMAKSQVPLSVKSATAPAVATPWKTKPTFAVVSTQDRAINPELERFMYKRAHSVTIELDSSHVAYMSHPAEVAALIEKAAQ